jgi:histo-blood group ABO system transferase
MAGMSPSILRNNAIVLRVEYNSRDLEPDLTIFCIATNKYLNYAVTLYESLAVNANNTRIEFILLTNGVFEPEESQLISHKVVRIHELGWPWATLMRYHLINTHRDLITSNQVCYIDADSIIHEPFWKDLEFNTFKNGIAVVEHPGYYRPENLNFYLRNPRYLLADLKSRITKGGLGSWETNRHSSSFVPRLLRRKYVCGGVWMGTKEAIIQMCNVLSKRIDLDLERNIIASWHDESHLNWYFSKYDLSLLAPSYCYASGRENIAALEMRIQAVDK